MASSREYLGCLCDMKLIIEQAHRNSGRVFTLSYIAKHLGIISVGGASRATDIIEGINDSSKDISAEYKFASKGGKFVATATISGVSAEQVASVLEGKLKGDIEKILEHQLQLHFEPSSSDVSESVLLLNGSHHPMWVLSEVDGAFTPELLKLADLMGEA